MIKQDLNKTTFYYAAIIALAVLLSYFNVINAGFISWDDADFTINNKDVKDFNIKAFFSNFYLGNYSPFTMLSFSLDHYFGKDSAWVYHLHNIFLHIINSILVFFLFNNLQKNKKIALLTALIFAIHPMQTESVSWISERKNMLLGLFYLLSLLSYIRYQKVNSLTNYLLVFFVFICALFSKGMAVSLPISLFAMDLWMNRSFNKKVFLEKIPFLILSFIFGLIAIQAQSSASFLKQDMALTFIEKTWFSSYSFMLYFLKLFIPINLSAIYPYPKPGFDPLYLLAFVFFISILFLLFRSIRKDQRILAGGLLFFTGNIIFVLQFVAQGAVLMADHYVYIASLGIIFPFTVFLFSFIKRPNVALTVSTIIVALFILCTHLRNSVWKNGINFWGDIAKKYPNSHIALSSLGCEYMLTGDNSKAFAYLNQAINLNPSYLQAYYNRGLFYANNGRFSEAIADFTKAAGLKNYTKATTARAGAYYELKDHSKALADIQSVLSIEPNNIKANYIAANVYNDLNELEKALFFYNKIILLDPNEKTFYLKRAIVLGKQQRFSECLNDLDICTNMDPNFAEAHYWKGVAKVNLKLSPCNDLIKAVDLGFETARGSMMKYCK